ncbi:MAG: DALR domain-containing protein [Anaerolineae bacterium]
MRPATGASAGGGESAVLAEAAERARAGFGEVMDDDFNTAGALGCLFELVTAINRARDARVGGEPFDAAQATLLELAGVLGLQLETAQPQGAAAAPFIDLLLELRAKLRVVKQYALADEVRNRLTDLGVVVEDTREGSTWRME